MARFVYDIDIYPKFKEDVEDSDPMCENEHYDMYEDYRSAMSALRSLAKIHIKARMYKYDTSICPDEPLCYDNCVAEWDCIYGKVSKCI